MSETNPTTNAVLCPACGSEHVCFVTKLEFPKGRFFWKYCMRCRHKVLVQEDKAWDNTQATPLSPVEEKVDLTWNTP